MTNFEKFEKYVLQISKWFNIVSGIALISMLVLITSDIIGNKIFKYPIPGGIEFVSFIAVIVTAFAIAQTQVLRGHIEVEFIVSRLPRKAQKIIGSIIYVFSMVLFLLLAWRSFVYGNDIRITGEVSITQGVPFYPFIYAIAVCSLVVFLVLLLQFLRIILKDRLAR